MRRSSIAVLFLILGLIAGSLASLHAEHERYSVVFDKNGAAIHVGDIILGSGGQIIKVHGFTSTYKAGTYAAYDYQVQACPKCTWVETLPPNGIAKVPAFNRSGVVTRVLQYFDLMAADGDSIIWGS